MTPRKSLDAQDLNSNHNKLSKLSANAPTKVKRGPIDSNNHNNEYDDSKSFNVSNVSDSQVNLN